MFCRIIASTSNMDYNYQNIHRHLTRETAMFTRRDIRILMFFFVLTILLAAVGVRESKAVGSTKKITASVSGVIWQDYCLRDCDAGSSLKRGNGRANPAEPRIAGVQVGLAKGKCRGKSPTQTIRSNSRGFYRFSNLSEGYYCVTVDSRQNQVKFQQPGYWSRPKESANLRIAQYQIKVIQSTNFVNISFGWNIYR